MQPDAGLPASAEGTVWRDGCHDLGFAPSDRRASARWVADRGCRLGRLRSSGERGLHGTMSPSPLARCRVRAGGHLLEGDTMTHRTRRVPAITGTLAVLLAASVPVPTFGAAPASAQGSFGPTGSLAEARVGHTSTLLPDGRVLIVGGDFNGERRASAELWAPAIGFGSAGTLTTARSGHTATLLSDGGVCPRCPPGRVLIVGGSADDVVASAELWDPVAGSFLPGGTLRGRSHRPHGDTPGQRPGPRRWRLRRRRLARHRRAVGSRYRDVRHLGVVDDAPQWPHGNAHA